MDYHKFIQAMVQLEQAAAAKRKFMYAALQRDVADALQHGDRPRASRCIEAFLKRRPGATRWWHQLALIRRQEGDDAGASAAWQQALRGDIGNLALLRRIGSGLRTAGHDPAVFALNAWATHSTPSDARQANVLSDDSREAWLHVLRGKWAEAIPAYRTMFDAEPARRRAVRNLTFLLGRSGKPGQAQCVLAVHQLALGDARSAVDTFDAAPKIDAYSWEFLPNFLRALRLVGDEARASGIAAGMPPKAMAPLAYREWADALMDMGRQADAIQALLQGGSAHDDGYLRLQADLILPPVPLSQDAMQEAHQRVSAAIAALSSSPLPASPAARASLVRSIGPNSFLPYLGLPYIEEARAYGDYAERLMHANFPDHAAPCPPRRRAPGEPIRVGCATSFVNHHVVMKCFTGALQHAEWNAIETHIFPLATEQDEVTRYVANLVHVCHPSTSDTETAARQIRESQLDLLIYPEIGLDALSFRLASMRLAPVQCVAAGHPTTTGLSTIDYFLSAAAAEPADASSHYTERLVALPGMGVCMPLPALPRQRKTRADFGLEPQQIIYLSTQGLFKHLPVHDALYARIAGCVDNAVFVFVEGHYPAWTRIFRERLKRTFESRGLSPERHLRFVPRQDYDAYLCLNSVSDVFLDPPGGWSGGMTVRDALASGLPVLTLPGTLMRTRQGYGLLTELGIRDTIASDLDSYVDLAVQIGNDVKLRASISQRIRERSHILFDDSRGVAGLTAFIRWATDTALPGDKALFELRPSQC